MPARSIEPTPEQLRELAGSTDTGPIAMLNLLRFKDQADGIDAADGISGREAYERYGEAVAKHLEGAGGHVTVLAECGESVIAPEGEAWDVVMLVSYPSRQAFLRMIADPGYQAEHAHRAAGLKDSRLVCCHAPAS